MLSFTVTRELERARGNSPVKQDSILILRLPTGNTPFQRRISTIAFLALDRLRAYLHGQCLAYQEVGIKQLPQVIQQRITRLNRKLRFMTDLDVARQACKHQDPRIKRQMAHNFLYTYCYNKSGTEFALSILSMMNQARTDFTEKLKNKITRAQEELNTVQFFIDKYPDVVNAYEFTYGPS